MEDPTLTLVRLLGRYLRVVKDDGSLANIHFSQEWYDRELLKNCDGQVTVGIEHNEDHKLSLDGSLRQRLSTTHINVWVTDKPEQGIVGRALRDKICAEVCRVIREKRNNPNTTDHNYVGIGTLTETHKAYHQASNTEPEPTDIGWTQLTDGEYQKIWYSDDDRLMKSVLENGKHSHMLFRFKIDAEVEVLKKIILRFEGYGTAPAGNGVTVKAWNFTESEWQDPAFGTGGSDEVLSITLASDLSDYIDAGGYVYMLAKTTNPSNGATPAILTCDFAELVLTVNGITHADIATFRDADEVRVKPFIWHTEFTIKTWLFENVPIT
jgi:hypothetical protein